MGCANGILERVKSLVLYGDPLTGKTTWARSLGEHVYSMRQLNLKELVAKQATAHYAVLDDVDIRFFPGYKEWLCQPYISAKLLYKDVTNIKWGRPSIWCTNKDPRNIIWAEINKGNPLWTEEDIQWLEANCIFVSVCKDEPLVTFHASKE